jgi:MarR family transcriptional regulator, lower aerobic nicotinate degradation pathway regulator
VKNTELIRLLQKFNEFDEAGTEKDFAQWLYQQHFPSITVQDKSDGSTERMLAYLLQRVGRLGRFFGKKPLQKHGLSNIDEFILITTIYNNPEIPKKALYEECVIELSTGTQIIKRLVAQGFVKEIANANDKRVTLLTLTARGVTLRNKCFDEMLEEVLFKFAPLNKKEKKNLLLLLIKLNDYLTGQFLGSQ